MSTITKRKAKIGPNDVVCVLSPYNPDFVVKARNLKGRWVAATKEWAFPVETEEYVDKLVMDIYGEQFGTETKYVTLKVTFGQSVSQYNAGIVIAGRSVAYAHGRDSGATLGDNVALITGYATSGGSVKNWNTKISEGAVIDIYKLSEIAAHKEMENPSYIGLTFEIMQSKKDKPDYDALREERNRLTQRLEEIDGILAKK